jgi:signal transduction histidine kinase
LIDEALNLACHGARAQDATFNIGLKRDYEPLMEPMEVAPQEMTRVILNLIGNGFYAAHKRTHENGDEPFQPLLRVATRDLGGTVEVRARDNGTGIPPHIKDKLFQPFFTTKPTGEGTGLGLSTSYDIVTSSTAGRSGERRGPVHRVHNPLAAAQRRCVGYRIELSGARQLLYFQAQFE